MGAILLAVTGLDPKPWEERFRRSALGATSGCGRSGSASPARSLMLAPGMRRTGLLARFCISRSIFSLGAGVDHIVADPHLPDVPVLRIVDADSPFG